MRRDEYEALRQQLRGEPHHGGHGVVIAIACVVLIVGWVLLFGSLAE